MKAGYFSPMPPAKSGVAEYSAELFPELRKLGEIALAPSHYGLGVYHIGNNGLHREIYRRALARPGITVLHDAVLQHFFLGGLSETGYVEEFVYNYGEWTRAEARLLWAERSASAQDERYFARGMLRRIVEHSRAVVVHNPGAAAIVRAHAPNADVREIPHFYSEGPPMDEAEVARFRGNVRYLFGVFGFLRESKRLLTILKAFSRLRRARPDVGLLIAGEFHSQDLRRAVEPYLTAPGVRRLGYMDGAGFSLACRAVDCCVNLRFPSAGETSGVAIRVMALGKALILTDGPENGAYPGHAYLGIPSGPEEESHLFEFMAMLQDSPAVGRAMGQRAREHIVRYHSLKAAAKQYGQIVFDQCW